MSQQPARQPASFRGAILRRYVRASVAMVGGFAGLALFFTLVTR